MLRHLEAGRGGGPEKVSIRNRTVRKRQGRVERVRISVLLDQTVGSDPEDLCPHFANGVYTPVSRRVESLVHGWVDGVVRGVDKVSDAGGAVGSPGAHGVLGLTSAAPNHGGQKVAPAFAHSSSLAPPKAGRVFGTARQARAETVAELVNNDASFEIAVSVGSSRVPEEHAHLAVPAVGGSHKVGIVHAGAVLRIGNHRVILLATAAKVVLLEVARDLVKAVSVVEIMYHVGRVEELGYGRVEERLGLVHGVNVESSSRSIREGKLQLFVSLWAFVVKVRIATLPVLLRQDVVANGRGGVPPIAIESSARVPGCRIVGMGERVPTDGGRKGINVLSLQGAFATGRIVDAPAEHFVRRLGMGVAIGDGGIRSPVDNGDDAVRSRCGHGSLIPVVPHLNFKLPHEVQGSLRLCLVGNLNVGHLDADGANGIRDIVGEKLDGASHRSQVAHVRDVHVFHILAKLGLDIVCQVFAGRGCDHEL